MRIEITRIEKRGQGISFETNAEHRSAAENAEKNHNMISDHNVEYLSICTSRFNMFKKTLRTLRLSGLIFLLTLNIF